MSHGHSLPPDLARPAIFYKMREGLSRIHPDPDYPDYDLDRLRDWIIEHGWNNVRKLLSNDYALGDAIENNVSYVKNLMMALKEIYPPETYPEKWI